MDFQSVAALTPPTGYPVAANLTAGYTQAEIENAGFLSGTAYADPVYSNFTDLDNWNDVGVIVLDRPVANIAPATIAPLNYRLGTVGAEQDAVHVSGVLLDGEAPDQRVGLGYQLPQPRKRLSHLSPVPQVSESASAHR